MRRYESVCFYLPDRLRRPVERWGDKLEDIRLGTLQPLTVFLKNERLFLNDEGAPVAAHLALKVTGEEVRETLDKMVQSSVYAVQDRLAQGYFTLPGGHRVGVAGSAVSDGERIVRLKDISALSIRFAREVKGAATPLFPYIAPGGKVKNTLIISPPGCGKTTLLRDISRHLAGDLYRLSVGIADERGEISAPLNGKSCLEVGECAAAICYAPKGEAMEMLLRSMRPEVILCDEIGGEREEASVFRLMNAGVKLICTAHGFSEEDVMRRTHIASLLREKVFECVITLSKRQGPSTLETVRC